MKLATERSLRFLVEKWLAPVPSVPVRVTEFSRTKWDNTRYVRVETGLPGGAHSLIFFRHSDGCWCVFPQRSEKRARSVETWRREVSVGAFV